MISCRTSWLVVASVLSVLCACTTSYGAAHGAHVVPRGKWELGGDANITLPVNLLGSVAAGANTLASVESDLNKGKSVNFDGNNVTPATVAIAALLADPPAPVPEFILHYGLLDNMDIGGRIGLGQVRSETYIQLIPGEWGLVLGFGVMGKIYWNGLLGPVALSSLGPLWRVDADATVLFGRDWHWVGFYVGGRFMYSRLLGRGVSAVEHNAASVVGINVFAGTGEALTPEAIAGLRVGPSQWHVFLEVDASRTLYHATVLGQLQDLGVWMVVPTLGVAFDTR